MMMWWICTALLIAAFVALSLRLRPQIALGMVIPIAYVLPSWAILPLFSTNGESVVGSGIDIKVAVGTACLILYCFMPRRTFPVRLVPLDFAMLALLIVHAISDIAHGSSVAFTLGRIYAEWYVPYITGRLCLQSRSDMAYLGPVMATLAGLVGSVAVLEALTNINLYETLFGQRPLEGFNREASRWGIQRAYGLTLHPIYFGVLQVLLLGWSCYAVVRVLHRRGAALWLLGLLPAVAGVLATGSRGPIFGMLISGVCGLFLWLPKMRWPLVGLALVGSLALFSAREQVLDQLERWVGEEGRPNTRDIAIDEESVAHSGTRNRLNLIEVYRIAIRRSGLLGFGTSAVTGFPINVPVGPREVDTLRRVKYIDNEYVLITLRFGYLGVAAFLSAALLSLGQFFFVAERYRGQSPQWLSCCLAATTAGVLVVLLSVWMPHEIGFPLVWTWGISSGLLVAHLQGHLRHVRSQPPPLPEGPTP